MRPEQKKHNRRREMHPGSSDGQTKDVPTDGRKSDEPSPGAQLTRYLLATGSVILLSMAVLTYLISNKVSGLVTHYVAQDTSSAITADLSKIAQELLSSTRLSEASMAQIETLKTQNLGIHSIKIWLRDGTLAYATDRTKIGQRFPSPTLAQAFSGEVIVTYNDLAADENQDERRLKHPLIEVYAPIFATGTKNVIAVGEYYKDASRLSEELSIIQIVIAALIAAVTLPMILVLYLLTRRANGFAREARRALKEKAEIASALSLRNDQLRQAAETARQDSIKSNEMFLQQIGHDLHDGPVQVLGALALKLSSMPARANDPEATLSLESATELNRKALKELRDIASGLVLPELEALTPEQALRLAIREHEAASGTSVTSSISELPTDIARSIKICLFRIVQEGLNNALRHAQGHGQQVTASVEDNVISITISDRGSDVTSQPCESSNHMPLGLLGLRRRVEILQGTLEFLRNGAGAELRVRLPIIPVS
jgi:signal transduction histidine kinase